MVNCPACAAAMSDESRYCSVCGARLSAPLAPLIEPSAAGSETKQTLIPSGPPSAPSPAALLEPPRFGPGTTLAGHYRIVSDLGKGGMGEVYQVLDVKLGREDEIPNHTDPKSGKAPCQQEGPCRGQAWTAAGAGMGRPP